MGTSLKVAPVSELLTFMPNVPRILINKTAVTHTTLDVMLLGDSDEIVQYLCDKLDWTLPPPEPVSSVVGEESEAAELWHEVQEQAEQEREADAGPSSSKHVSDTRKAPSAEDTDEEAAKQILEPEPVADFEWIWHWPSAHLEGFRSSAEDRECFPDHIQERAARTRAGEEEIRERELAAEQARIQESVIRDLEEESEEDDAEDE